MESYTHLVCLFTSSQKKEQPNTINHRKPKPAVLAQKIFHWSQEKYYLSVFFAWIETYIALMKSTGHFSSIGVGGCSVYSKEIKHHTTILNWWAQRSNRNGDQLLLFHAYSWSSTGSGHATGAAEVSMHCHGYASVDVIPILNVFELNHTGRLYKQIPSHPDPLKWKREPVTESLGSLFV